MKGREAEWGPFTFLTGPAGKRRRVPKVGRNRVGKKPHEYTVGLWVSWRGGMLSVCRNRWYQREATWRNQTVCLARRLWRVFDWPDHDQRWGVPIGGHDPLTIVTRAALDGMTPDTAAVRILDSHVACRRCGLVLKGAKWVNR